MIMREYTRLVSSTFWKKLEERSTQQIVWDNTEEMIQYLTDPTQNSTLAFVIARILQRRFPDELSGTTPSDELPGCVPPGEIPLYVRLIRRLLPAAGMEGAFRNSQLEKYLSGETRTLSRDNCFRLAFALAMDEDDVLDLLQVCSLPPFNFRSPEELIYFFCFCSQRIADETGEPNPFGWQFANELYADVKEAMENAQLIEKDIAPGQSAFIEDDVLNMLDEPSSPAEKAALLRDYLLSQAPVLSGYPRRAYQCFDELLDEITDLLSYREEGSAPEKMSARLSWLAGQMYRNIWPQYGDGTTGDFVPLKKSTPSLPSNLTSDPLWRARLLKLANREVPVTKHDLLFLCMICWDLAETETDGKDAVESYLLEANDILYKAGMSGVYIPDNYDRLILLSIASGCPTAFLGDFYEAGADESIIRELIEKNRNKEKKTH